MTPRLDVVGLVVGDMAASLAFYRRLGLEFPDGADAEGHVETTVADGMRIAFDTHAVMRSFDPKWTEPDPAAPPRMSLAFRVESPAAVDALYRELADAGYETHLEPFDAFWGQRYATLRDPDGNPVDLYAPLS